MKAILTIIGIKCTDKGFFQVHCTEPQHPPELGHSAVTYRAIGDVNALRASWQGPGEYSADMIVDSFKGDARHTVVSFEKIKPPKQ